MAFIIALFIFSCSPQNTTVHHSSAITKDSQAIAVLFAKTRLNKDSGQSFIAAAQRIAVDNNSVKCRAVYMALLAKELIYSGLLDSAGTIADSGLRLNYAPDDRMLKGKFYNIKGNVAGFKKKVYPSIEYYLKAEQLYASAGDSASLAGIYSNVANAYFSLKDYASAYLYAAKAYSLLASVREVNIVSNIITTYAVSLNKTGRDKEALAMAQQADSVAEATQNKMAKIAAIIGLAEVHSTLRNYDTARVYYHRCISLGAGLGIKHFELMGRMGLLALNEVQGRTEDLVKEADTAIALANQLHNADVLHTAKRILGKALGKQGRFEKGFRLLNESYALYDSVAGIENQKNINELLIKYDAAKKEKEILNQNLLLANQDVQLRNRQIIIAGLFLGLSLLSVVSFYVRKLNRERLMRLEIEKQKKVGDAYILGEQKERTRLALEIHDGIASMLTGISYKLRSCEDNKEEVIGLLARLHEDTRRIAHSLMPVDFEQKNLVEALQLLCEKMTTKEIEVVFYSNVQQLQLEAQKSLFLYRLIQELINNAFKYAQCKSVFVRLERNEKTLDISVEDDGTGISEALISKGFNSIKERIKASGAVWLIESAEGVGTAIKISCNNEWI